MEENIKRNVFWNSLGSFVYLIAQWLLTFFVVRISTTLTDAGNLSLAISITNIFFNIACFNVRPFMVSDIEEKYTIDEYVSFRTITCLISIILCFIYILFFNYSFTQLMTIMLFMLFKVGEAVVDVFHSIEQRASRMDIGGLSLLIRGVILLIMFVIGMIVFSNLNIAIILMILGTWLFIYLFDYKMVRNFSEIHINIKISSVVKMFWEFFPLAIAAFIGTFCTSLPRQFLESMRGTEVLGVYATIATPAVIVQVATTYIYNPILVSFANLRTNHCKKEFINLFVKVSMIIFGIGVASFIGAIFLGHLGLYILYGQKIAKYSYLFLPIILYTAINGYFWFCGNIMIIFRRKMWIVITNLTGLVICLCFSSLFINLFSMNGVTLVMLLLTILMTMEYLFIIIKEIKNL